MSQANERSADAMRAMPRTPSHVPLPPPPSTHFELLVIKFLFNLMQCQRERLPIPSSLDDVLFGAGRRWCGWRQGARRGSGCCLGITASQLYSEASVQVATPLIAAASIYARLSFVLRVSVSFLFSFSFLFTFSEYEKRKRGE